jgi:uncharacterized membrane protein
MNLLKKLNLQRKGDENIGRLIVFAITIVIAIGVVSLVSYFYNENRENAATTATVFSQTASVSDLDKLNLLTTTVTNEAVDIQYSALDGVYTATFTGTAAEALSNEFATGIAGVASDVDATGTAVVTYKVKQ